MSTFIKSTLTSAIFVAMLVAASFAVLPSVAAHDGEDHEQIAQEATEEAPAEETATEAYSYVAQPGDTYTQMARKAIQTYGIVNEVNLTPAEIVFAETNLTLEAGSPILTVGQEVSINTDTVKSWVERAQQLSDETEAEWNYYVQFVDFNTDHVGEAAA